MTEITNPSGKSQTIGRGVPLTSEQAPTGLAGPGRGVGITNPMTMTPTMGRGMTMPQNVQRPSSVPGNVRPPN